MGPGTTRAASQPAAAVGGPSAPGRRRAGPGCGERRCRRHSLPASARAALTAPEDAAATHEGLAALDDLEAALWALRPRSGSSLYADPGRASAGHTGRLLRLNSRNTFINGCMPHGGLCCGGCGAWRQRRRSDERAQRTAYWPAVVGTGTREPPLASAAARGMGSGRRRGHFGGRRGISQPGRMRV